MKFIIALILTIGSLFGQQNDGSMWFRNSKPIPWYMYVGKKATVDLRYNFDADKTGGACLGKAFGKESLTLIPEACGYIGETNGYGPELLILSSKGDWFTFSQNQFLQGVGSPSYLYHWRDIQRKVRKWVSIGGGEQIFKEISSLPGQIDLGPSMKFILGKTYVKIWQAWSIGPANRGQHTSFIGVGYAW